MYWSRSHLLHYSLRPILITLVTMTMYNITRRWLLNDEYRLEIHPRNIYRNPRCDNHLDGFLRMRRSPGNRSIRWTRAKKVKCDRPMYCRKLKAMFSKRSKTRFLLYSVDESYTMFFTSRVEAPVITACILHFFPWASASPGRNTIRFATSLCIFLCAIKPPKRNSIIIILPLYGACAGTGNARFRPFSVRDRPTRRFGFIVSDGCRVVLRCK
jgi:hypothetical protein